VEPLRLAFFGTPDFAVPTLERLRAGRHPVVVVVSQPDRGRGRGRRRTPSPVATHALQAGLPLLRPEKVQDAEVVRRLHGFAPDLGIVVAFGQFLPRQIRALPSRGYLINGHASLLPRHRGAAPIPYAILCGDAETGVSVMRVERRMDAGPVALVRRLDIGPSENAGSLGTRVAELTAEAIATVVEQVAADSVSWLEQDEGAATLAPKITRRDGQLDPRQPAHTLVRRVRALAPRPGAYLQVGHEALRVLEAKATPGSAPDPGLLVCGGDPPLRVATAQGWLCPVSVQRPGGRPLPAAEFLRGFRLPPGARALAPPSEAGETAA